MATEDAKKCRKCKNYLYAPVVRCLASSTHCYHKKCINFFDTCLNCGALVLSADEPALEKTPVLQNCGFCSKECSLIDLAKHENECRMNKRYVCEMNKFCKPRNACTWEGALKDIAKHFEWNHKRLFTENPVQVEIVMNQFYRYILPAEKFGELFYYKHIVFPRNNEIHFAVQVVGTSEKAKKYKYKLQLESADGKLTKVIEFSCMSDTEDMMKLCQFRNCAGISLDELKPFLQNGILRFHLNIVKVERTNSTANQDSAVKFSCELSQFFNSKNSCNWLGYYKEVPTHFRTHTPIAFGTNPVSVDVRLDKYHRYIQLIEKHDKLFFYKQAINPRHNKMNFVVQLVGSSEEAEKFTYKLKFVSKADADVAEFKFRCVSNSKNVMDIFKSNSCGVIPLEILTKFVQNNSLRFHIDIVSGEVINQTEKTAQNVSNHKQSIRKNHVNQARTSTQQKTRTAKTADKPEIKPLAPSAPPMETPFYPYSDDPRAAFMWKPHQMNPSSTPAETNDRLYPTLPNCHQEKLQRSEQPYQKIYPELSQKQPAFSPYFYNGNSAPQKERTGLSETVNFSPESQSCTSNETPQCVKHPGSLFVQKTDGVFCSKCVRKLEEGNGFRIFRWWKNLFDN